MSVVTEQRARVVNTSGAAPVTQGESCLIRVEPAKGEPYNCRVVVRCGNKVLYGAVETSGFAHCTVDAGVATSAKESAPDDSDPDLYYDLATARATVKEPHWQVDLELEGGPPR